MIISFNGHYEGANWTWEGPLPLDPDRAFDAAFCFMKGLHLDKSKVYTIVAPGVREGCIIVAYHALMGHFPFVLYPVRREDEYVWLQADFQAWRDTYRNKRSK